MEDDAGFLSGARDMLDIEMSGALKDVRVLLTNLTAVLDDLGMVYMFKVCEESVVPTAGRAMNILCKCSPMKWRTALAFLEYEQRRCLNAMSDDDGIMEL